MIAGPRICPCGSHACVSCICYERLTLGLALCSSRYLLPITTVVPSAMSGLRQRPAKEKRRSVSPFKHVQTNGKAAAKRGDKVAVATSVAGALLDYSVPLLLVFGGCCSYVSTLLISPGLALTIKSPPAMSGPMKNYFARIPALVCMQLLLFPFLC